MGFAESSFRDFENHFRIVVSLDENDIQFILKQYNSHFITYEQPPGKYSIKDISEIVYTKGDRPGTLQLEHDDFSMKTKLALKQFRGTFVMIRRLRFEE